MKGDEFIGSQPTSGRWSVDGKKVYFEWNPNNLGTDTYWDKSMIKPQLTSSAEAAFSKLSFKSKPNDRLLY
jgi:hypothetical protein